jgi:hypothetical protein
MVVKTKKKLKTLSKVDRKKNKLIELTFTRPDDLFRKRKKKRKLISSLFVLLVISLGLSAYFGILDSRADDTSVLLEIQSEQEVVSGDSVVYKIFFQNNEETSLTKMNLSLTYPDGFEYESSSIEPANEGQNYWELDDLASNFAATLEIHGRIIGDVDERKQIKAVLAYEPANFSSTFTQDSSFEQIVSGLKVDMWVDASPEAMSAQEVQFKIHILNKQTSEWTPLVVSFNNPEQFLLMASEPTATILNNQWEIMHLAPEEEYIITIVGELAPQVEMDKLFFTTELFEEINGERELLDTDDVVVKIVEPTISVDLSFVEDQSSVVDWEGIVSYQLVVKNTGEYIPDNLRIIFVFDTDFINWKAWQDTIGLYREDNKIIWTSEHPKIGDKLKDLQTGEEIRLKIGAQLQSAPIDASTLSDSDLIVSTIVKVEADIGSEKYVSASDILRVHIGQSFDFVAKAKYYDSEGERIGSGPLPPRVDKETEYIIEWQLFSGAEDLQNIQLSTTLPPYVEWLDEQQDDEFVFDSTKRELSIKISSLEKSTSLIGAFRVGVTPSRAQIGQHIAIINPITLSAKTKTSREEIIKQINLIDTDLVYDIYAENKGRVVE